jgi:hypothetical protein
MGLIFDQPLSGASPSIWPTKCMKLKEKIIWHLAMCVGGEILVQRSVWPCWDSLSCGIEGMTSCGPRGFCTIGTQYCMTCWAFQAAYHIKLRKISNPCWCTCQVHDKTWNVWAKWECDLLLTFLQIPDSVWPFKIMMGTVYCPHACSCKPLWLFCICHIDSIVTWTHAFL